MTLELRPYQSDALNAMWEGLHGEPGNLLTVLPTGTGKSLVIAEFVRGWLGEYPDSRVLILTHSQELVQQNYLEMMGIWPSCPAGVYAAGLNRREINSQVLFGAIQSLHRRAYQLQRVNLILVDEAHSIPRKTNTMWGKFLAEVLTINPDCRIVGLTATAFRLDSGMLHEGDDAMFSRIVYEYDIKDAIRDGFLCEPVSVGSLAQIDTTGVATRAGEFVAGELEAVAMDPDTVASVAGEIVKHGADRRGWIVFGCGIVHCTALRDAIRERGYSCEAVFGDTDKAERRQVIDAFKAQRIRALVSVGVLTTGFNAPHCDLVALARPTKSAGLYIQAIGRGTRLYPGKENALVLDMGGNLQRFGPINAVKVKSAGKGDGAAPTKKCPTCEAAVPISARECAECGHEFPAEGSKINVKTSTAAVLSSQIKPEWVPVTKVSYGRHQKVGKPPSMSVIYQCGMLFHREWICLEHQGFAREQGVRWWHRRAPGTPAPRTVDEALERAPSLPQPVEIAVRPEGKYIRITGAKFAA